MNFLIPCLSSHTALGSKSLHRRKCSSNLLSWPSHSQVFEVGNICSSRSQDGKNHKTQYADASNLWVIRVKLRASHGIVRAD